MLFSSLEFLLLFVPIVYGLYFLFPIRLRNGWLLAASLFFYAWGEPVFVLIMIGSIGLNYVLALRIEELEGKAGARRLILIIAVAMNLGILMIFKYMNFITESLHRLWPQTASLFPKTAIALPIGISFFTFQALSYVIDVYRGTVKAQKNAASLGLYISMFPQLIAGPIVRYATIAEQIDRRQVTFSSFSDGVLRFMMGFNKKVLLANVLAEVADKAFGTAGLSVGMAWLGAVCYALQILFDFSGYSDMAIGLGKMLGFDFLENFNYPYISRTITEFWRRWHISLGTWFRDYVYFPMGGSRVKSRGRLVLNLAVVWLLTGLWHGAEWTFILWGALYGVVIILEKLTGLPRKLEKRPEAVRTLYRVVTLLLILLGWVLFRAENLGAAAQYLCCMFGAAGNPLTDNVFVFYSREYIVYLLIGLLCCTPVFRRIGERMRKAGKGWSTLADGAGAIGQLVLFMFSVTMLVMNAHNPFIYFNF